MKSEFPMLGIENIALSLLFLKGKTNLMGLLPNLYGLFVLTARTRKRAMAVAAEAFKLSVDPGIGIWRRRSHRSLIF